MSSNITEDILMTFVNDLEGEDWADSFLFDPSSSLQSSHVIPTSKIPSSPILSRGNSNQLDVNASNDSFDKLWMDDILVEYESSISESESSKKFVPTVSRKVEPDWTRNFENDHFPPLISVDDILSFDDDGLSSHNSSPLYKGSPPPRKASSTGMLDGANLTSSEAIRLKNKRSKLSQFLKNKSFKKYKKMSLSSRLQKVVDYVRSQRGSASKDTGTSTPVRTVTASAGANLHVQSVAPKLPFVYPTPQETTEKFLQLLLGKSENQTLPADFLDIIHQRAVFESPSLASFVTQVKKMNVSKNLNAWVPVGNDQNACFPSTHTGIGQIAAASRGFSSALRDVMKSSILEKLTFSTQLRNTNNSNMMASLLFTSKNQISVSFIWKSAGLKAQGYAEELECIGLIRCHFQPEGIKKISLSFDACKIIRQVSAMGL